VVQSVWSRACGPADVTALERDDSLALLRILVLSGSVVDSSGFYLTGERHEIVREIVADVPARHSKGIVVSVVRRLDNKEVARHESSPGFPHQQKQFCILHYRKMPQSLTISSIEFEFRNQVLSATLSRAASKIGSCIRQG